MNDCKVNITQAMKCGTKSVHNMLQQECIPVGCLLSAAVAAGGGGVYPSMLWAGGVSDQEGVCPGGVCHTPPWTE